MREKEISFCCANELLAFHRFLEVTPAGSLQRRSGMHYVMNFVEVSES